jgi:hypothetical protein
MLGSTHQSSPSPSPASAPLEVNTMGIIGTLIGIVVLLILLQILL